MSIELIRANVPEELRARNCWCLWAEGKIPLYAPTASNRWHALDSAEDRALLVDFETAAKALPKIPRARGFGVALGDGLAGLDFDSCYTDGVLDPRVAQVVAAANSFAERSLSGNGVHVLGTGGFPAFKTKGAECYSSKRFFITGHGDVILQAPLRDLTQAAALVRELWGRDESRCWGRQTDQEPPRRAAERCAKLSPAQLAALLDVTTSESSLDAPPIEVVLKRLKGVTPSGPGSWKALCPGHDDRVASLSVRELGGGRVGVTCFAGCDARRVLGAIGLSLRDLYPSRSVLAFSFLDPLSASKSP